MKFHYLIRKLYRMHVEILNSLRQISQRYPWAKSIKKKTRNLTWFANVFNYFGSFPHINMTFWGKKNLYLMKYVDIFRYFRLQSSIDIISYLGWSYVKYKLINGHVLWILLCQNVWCFGTSTSKHVSTLLHGAIEQ